MNHGFSRFVGTSHTAVDDGALYAGDQFARLLRARGVTVAGTIAHGKEPEGAIEIAKIDSAPVSAIVVESESSSDNGGTEDLIREIGVKASKDGSTAAGVAAATAKLAELGVPMTGVSLVDGSGLARDNRVTCRGSPTRWTSGCGPSSRRSSTASRSRACRALSPTSSSAPGSRASSRARPASSTASPGSPESSTWDGRCASRSW